MDMLNPWRDDILTYMRTTKIDWNGACLKAQTQTINTKFKLLQYIVYIVDEGLHDPCQTSP